VHAFSEEQKGTSDIKITSVKVLTVQLMHCNNTFYGGFDFW
jgi:hypothetical protein